MVNCAWFDVEGELPWAKGYGSGTVEVDGSGSASDGYVVDAGIGAARPFGIVVTKLLCVG